MNIERSRAVPERKLTDVYLAKKLHSFANVLAHGRWLQPDVYSVETTQCVVEHFGDGHEIGGGEIEVEPIFNEVTVSFAANKQIEEEDGEFFSLPRYTITSTVAQDIDKAEMPSHVLDEVFNGTRDGTSLAHELFEEAGFADVLDRDEPFTIDSDDADNLDQFQIKRLQELEYTINYAGQIEDYRTSYGYSFDDVMVHSAEYQLSNGLVITRPVTDSRGNIVDQQPVYIPQLNARTLEEHLATLDQRADSFFIEETIRELELDADMPPQEHIRRVLGMLSIVSSGYAPRRWYTNTYDYLLHRWQRQS